MQSIQVSILGQEFRLKSDSSPEEVQQITSFVEEQISAITSSGRVIDSLQVAVLALFNVSASYIKKEGLPSGPDGVPEERITGLVDRIERALDGRG